MLFQFLFFLILIQFFLYKRKVNLLLPIILIIYFFSNGLIINRVIGLWEVEGVKIEKLNNYECAIILSGSFKFDKKLNRLILNSDGDRIWQVIQLYKKKKIKKIVLSGSPENVSDSKKYKEMSIKSLLISMGVSETDILEEKLSKNTFENAKFSKKILAKHKLLDKPILLVTSSVHMRRARACFEKQGVHSDPFATSQVNGSKTGFKLKWLIPNVENLLLWNKFSHESLGFLFYKINGYI